MGVTAVGVALVLAPATGLVSAESLGVALAFGVDKAAKTRGVLGVLTDTRATGVGVAMVLAVGVLGACGVAVTPMRTMANLRADGGATDKTDEGAMLAMVAGADLGTKAVTDSAAGVAVSTNAATGGI